MDGWPALGGIGMVDWLLQPLPTVSTIDAMNTQVKSLPARSRDDEIDVNGRNRREWRGLLSRILA